jgi:hypothetical protein
MMCKGGDIKAGEIAGEDLTVLGLTVGLHCLRALLKGFTVTLGHLILGHFILKTAKMNTKEREVSQYDC